MSPIPDDPNQAQAWITGDPPDQTIDFYIPRGNQGIMGPQGPIGPSLSVGEVVTVQGPAAPGTIGATGLTGPKGDPGGLVAATSLAGSPDLNTITTPGTYRNIDNLNATTQLNFPLGGVAGNLLVIATGPSIVTQIMWPINGAYGSRVQWVRSYNASWSPWRSFNSTRIDNTVGRAIYQWDDTVAREQLVYGDTGSRDITTLRNLTNTTGGVFEIRRTNYSVTLSLRAVAAASSGTIEILPANVIPNFEPNTSQADLRGVVVSAAGEARMLQIATNGQIMLYSATSGGAYSGSVTWATNRAWPTSLPGAVIGTVPNL